MNNKRVRQLIDDAIQSLQELIDETDHDAQELHVTDALNAVFKMDRKLTGRAHKLITQIRHRAKAQTIPETRIRFIRDDAFTSKVKLR